MSRTLQRQRGRIQLNPSEAIDRWVLAGPDGAISLSIFDRIPGVSTRVAEAGAHSPTLQAGGIGPTRCDVLEGGCYPEILPGMRTLALAAAYDRSGDSDDELVWRTLADWYAEYFGGQPAGDPAGD